MKTSRDVYFLCFFCVGFRLQNMMTTSYLIMIMHLNLWIQMTMKKPIRGKLETLIYREQLFSSNCWKWVHGTVVYFIKAKDVRKQSHLQYLKGLTEQLNEFNIKTRLYNPKLSGMSDRFSFISKLLKKEDGSDLY